MNGKSRLVFMAGMGVCAASFGCSAGSGSASDVDTGRATFLLAQVPPDALCLEINAVANRTTTRRFDITPGAGVGPPVSLHVRSVLVDPFHRRTFYAMHDNQWTILKSTDGGKTWLAVGWLPGHGC